MLRSSLVSALAGIIVLCVSLSVIVGLPQLPYNIRKLFEPEHLYASAALFCAAVYCSFGAPVSFAHWLGGGPFRRLLICPFLIVVHGGVTWIAMRWSVRKEMIDKITGSPILHWPWHWKSLGRFVGLFAAPISRSVTLSPISRLSA